MHKMLHEGLEDVLPYMVNPEQPDEKGGSKHNNNNNNGKPGESDEDSDDSDDEKAEIKMSLDELVSGALESTFWAMDR